MTNISNLKYLDSSKIKGNAGMRPSTEARANLGLIEMRRALSVNSSKSALSILSPLLSPQTTVQEGFGVNPTPSFLSNSLAPVLNSNPVFSSNFTDLFGNPVVLAGINLKHLTKATIRPPFHSEEVAPVSGVSLLGSEVKSALKVVRGRPERCSAGGYIPFTCPSGHLIRKQIGCNREYCQTCGKEWGLLHQQRYFRGVRKIEYIFSLERNLGYFVFTLPKRTHLEIDKKQMSKLQTYITKLFQRKGFGYGVSVWHWCGEDGKTFKPHLNILLPSGFISPNEDLMKELKSLWTKKVNSLLNIYSGKSTPYVVNYNYVTDSDRNKIYHRWKYVCRPTWRKYSDEIKDKVFNYRNIRWWGDYKNKLEENSLELTDKCKCPVCTQPLTVSQRFGFVPEINTDDYTHLGGGVYVWNYQVSESMRSLMCKPPDLCNTS